MWQSSERVREKIAERVTPHLPRGEQYRIAFQAEKPLLGINGLLPRYRVIAVTDLRVHLFTSDLWSFCTPDTLLGTYSRRALIHRRRVFLSHEIHIGNEQLWVRMAWQDLLQEALTECARPG